MSTPDPAAGPDSAAVPSDPPADRGPAPIPTPGVGDSVTGVPSVDLALGRLDGLVGVPTSDHAGVYEQVHAELRSALEDTGEGAGRDAATEPVPGPTPEPGATAAS